MPPTTVRQAIRLILGRNATASQRSILRELRASGFRIANIAGRSIINELKTDAKRAIQQGARNFEYQIGSANVQSSIQFRFRERDLQGISDSKIERILRQNIKNDETFVRRRGKTTRLTDFTHVAMNYRATAQVTIYIEGRVYSQERIETSGMFTTEVGAFTEELLAERIRQQVEGRAVTNVGLVQGLGANSIIDGIRAQVEILRVETTALEPRGSKRLRRG